MRSTHRPVVRAGAYKTRGQVAYICAPSHVNRVVEFIESHWQWSDDKGKLSRTNGDKSRGEDGRWENDLCVRLRRTRERERKFESRGGDAWSEKGDTEHAWFEDAYSSEVDCAKARLYTLISPIASRTIMRLPKIGERHIPCIPYIDIEIRSRESRQRGLLHWFDVAIPSTSRSHKLGHY